MLATFSSETGLAQMLMPTTVVSNSLQKWLASYNCAIM